MTTGYIILETGFEYNDEINYASENGGGHPVQIYLNQEKALAKMKEMNIQTMCDTGLNEYFYSVDEMFNNVPKVKKICEKYISKLVADYELDTDDTESFSHTVSKCLEIMTMPDKEAIYAELDLEFYTLAEVDIDSGVLEKKVEPPVKKGRFKTDGL